MRAPFEHGTLKMVLQMEYLNRTAEQAVSSSEARSQVLHKCGSHSPEHRLVSRGQMDAQGNRKIEKRKILLEG